MVKKPEFIFARARAMQVMSSRVLISLGALNVGGAELRTLQFLEGIRARGLQSQYDVYIYIVSGKKGALDARFILAGARLIYGAPSARGLFEISRICRSLKIDLFIANAALAGGFYCLAARIGGSKRQISYIRSTSYDRSGFLFSLRNTFYRLFLNSFSNEVIGVCCGARDIAWTPKRRWRTIYNGVKLSKIRQNDARNILHWNDGAFNIVMVGRLHTPKNPSRALSIVSKFQEMNPAIRVKLHFVGRSDPQIKSAMNAEIARLNLADNVEFHGECEDPQAFISAASLLLLP